MDVAKLRSSAQESLFGDELGTGAAALVTVAAKPGQLSKPQRTFNSLAERIRRGRELLAAWEAFIPRFQTRLTRELAPIEDEMRETQRRVVQQLQALLAGANTDRLSRRHRAKVRALLLQVVANLLEDGPDAELEALHDRYSHVSHAERSREELELAEALFGQVFGRDVVRGHEARNVDELMDHAVDKMAAAAEMRERKASARQAPRGRASRAAERKAQEAREASQSVRDIYRKLASALHPDRETDPTERDRKTALIQRANQAYERNDLLELLTLQIETEQIDAGALADVPEARLGHYNRVLLEQAHVLEAEVRERAAVFRIEFDLTMRDVTPERVEQALNVRIAEARNMLTQMERDLERLGDPRQRRAVLDDLPEPEDYAPDFEDLAAVARLSDDPFAAAPRRARRRQRGRR
jgi:hypothetical protein